MTEEKTISDTEGDSVDIESTMALDKHNPLGPVGSDITEQMVKVIDVSIPSIRRILNSRKPSISITAETESEKEIDLELILDEFAESVDEKISLASFCSAIGIDKQDLYDVIDESVPLRISRTGEEFDVNLPKESERVDIENKNEASWRFNRLCDLWKAKEYGKARIVNIKEQSNRGFIFVLEIPWLNETKKIRFSTSKQWDSTYPSFPSFYKSLIGRYPINEEEVSSIVGEEVPLDYNGRIKLEEEMIDNMEEQKESFIEYLKKNDLRYLTKIFENLLTLGPSYLSPAIVSMLIFGAVMFLPMSAISGWTLLGLLVASPIIASSTIDAYNRYNSRQPISRR